MVKVSKGLMINFPAEGHINPTIGLVKELVKRGEKIVYYCEDAYVNKLKGTGVEFRGYKDLLQEFNVENRVKYMFDKEEMLLRLCIAIDKTFPEILKEIKNEKFDYIIFDSHFLLGQMLAEKLQIPAIGTCTTFAMNEKMLRNFSTKFGGEKSNSEKMKRCEEILKKLAAENGLQGFTNIEEVMKHMLHYHGDMQLVFTSKQFQPFGESFNDTYQFVGPSISDRRIEVPFPYEKLSGRKIIYISMGTEVNNQPNLYKVCFQALRDLEVDVVMSVGREIKLEKLGEVPGNFIICEYVPQLEILRKAALFITHGGMNSVNEGLYFGVPLIVLPIVNDQPVVAKRVEELGAGIACDYKDITMEKLSKAVGEILTNNTYREKSFSIGSQFKAAGGFQKAADEILRCIKRES
ncbi:macrolide family glycosyltransferase [Bacillus thuringiensis]|nr:macrolide family glycosyltransferase [Bacillus thuringiensis]MDZ3952430.1 macrolide family glycosyltransferase [Bacillus thuringiensis]